jgi:hypothetical protein
MVYARGLAKELPRYASVSIRHRLRSNRLSGDSGYTQRREAMGLLAFILIAGPWVAAVAWLWHREGGRISMTIPHSDPR